MEQRRPPFSRHRAFPPDVQMPATTSCGPIEACLWASEALNRCTTETNPGCAWPNSLFYGMAAPLVMLPFLKPSCCRVRRDSKAAPQAGRCLYLSGRSNHPSSARKAKLPSGAVVDTRDVRWAQTRETFTLPKPAGGGEYVSIYSSEPPSSPLPLPQGRKLVSYSSKSSSMPPLLPPQQ